MDICNPYTDKSYDGILCLCNSFNYLLKDERVRVSFQGVYRRLRDNGVFPVGIHSVDRLEKSAEEYNKTGHVKDLEYQ